MFLQGFPVYLFGVNPGFAFSLVFDDFNLLGGTPVCCLASAGNWESEMIQTWSQEFEVLTASLFKLD